MNPGSCEHGAGAVRLATHAMGTRFEVVLPGDDGAFLQSAGEAAVELIESLHRRWSRFDRGSVISSINRAAGKWVRVDSETLDVLGTAERVRIESGDAFSAALDAGGIAAPIENGDGTVRIAAGSRLDLGGIAKGAALALVDELFDEIGVEAAFVHGGTSAVLARGTPGDDAWKVRLASPGQSSAVLELRDEVLCVSAVEPAQGMHITDPRTGAPADGSAAGAVVAPLGRAAEADAWATALCVLGNTASAPDGLRCFTYDTSWMENDMQVTA